VPGGGGSIWFETLLAAWMRARGTGRRRREKRTRQEEDGALEVWEALARRAATAAPREHVRFVRAALSIEAALSANRPLVDDTKILPVRAEENAEGTTVEEEQEVRGVARQCWRALVALDASLGGGDSRRSQLLRKAAQEGAAAAVHAMLDAGAGRDDAQALLVALARASVPWELPAAAHACAVANHAANRPAAEVAAAGHRRQTRVRQAEVLYKRALAADPNTSVKDTVRRFEREVGEANQELEVAKWELEKWHDAGLEQEQQKWEDRRRAHPGARTAEKHAAAARGTEYWRAVLRLVAAGGDPTVGDVDGADASSAAAMLLRPAEVPAALVADLLGPQAVAATGAGAAPAGSAPAATAAACPHTLAAPSPPVGSLQLPVHAAAAQGDIGLMRELLRGGGVGAREPGSGEMALHVASAAATAAVVLAAGATVSGRNAAGHTALAAAAADDNARLVAELLDAGAPFDGEPTHILHRHALTPRLQR